MKKGQLAKAPIHLRLLGLGFGLFGLLGAIGGILQLGKSDAVDLGGLDRSSQHLEVEELRWLQRSPLCHVE